MDCLLLRKLTEKSIMKFGKYADSNVGTLLNLNLTVYLRWVYFNMSMITFTDEILEKIKIPLEYRIEKPGIKPEFADEVYNYNLKRRTNEIKLKNVMHNKRTRKGKLACFNALNSVSKGKLQSLNHGK